MHILIIGAGLSGAVIARGLAEAGHSVTVVDERDHVAGNCHTTRDAATGVMVHVHGPHIFHTDDPDIWAFVTRFAEMMPYRHRVKARVGGQVYSLPINLHTINQFFRTALSPSEARQFLDRLTTPIADAASADFETRALSLMGEDLYRAFFAGYTSKQWGLAPAALPGWLLGRLPFRLTYDDSYFNHAWQAIPRDGYTAMTNRMLDHARIKVTLGTVGESAVADQPHDHLIYSGKLDRYYSGRFGPLGYRTLDFERIDHNGDFQGVAVMNHCDPDVPFTRITEHSHFAPWEKSAGGRSVAYREYSRDCGPDDIPYYPLRLAGDQDRLRRYVDHALGDSGVTFVGRLGTYSYLDMDVAIRRALDTVDVLSRSWAMGKAPPVFVHDPLVAGAKA
jgi:UDP-galactopyranose mutase